MNALCSLLRADSGRLHDEYIFGLKTQLDIVQGHEAFHQQPRTGEEHDRQRDLRHDEHSARARDPAAHDRPRSSLLERVDQIDLRRMDCRSKTEQHAGCDRNDQRECEHAHLEIVSVSRITSNGAMATKARDPQ